MDEWIRGDYVRTSDDEVYQILRVHGTAVYLEHVLRTQRMIAAVDQVRRMTPRETAKALMEAWLLSDYFADD